MAGRGEASLASTTTVLPPTSAGANRDTRPSNDGASGATMPTTPTASGEVTFQYGPATGFSAPDTCCTLSVQPAYQTHRSMAAWTSFDGNCERRPSSTSATR